MKKVPVRRTGAYRHKKTLNKLHYDDSRSIILAVTVQNVNLEMSVGLFWAYQAYQHTQHGFRALLYLKGRGFGTPQNIG